LKELEAADAGKRVWGSAELLGGKWHALKPSAARAKYYEAVAREPGASQSILMS